VGLFPTRGPRPAVLRPNGEVDTLLSVRDDWPRRVGGAPLLGAAGRCRLAEPVSAAGCDW